MPRLTKHDTDYLIAFLEEAIYANQTAIEVLNYQYANQGVHKCAKALYQQVRAHCHLTGRPWPMYEPSMDELHEVA